MIKLVTTLDCYLKGQLIDNIIPIDLITIANIYNIPTITIGDVENIFREVTA